MTRVFITEIKRSAIGKYLGKLAPVSPVEMGTQLLKQMIQLGNIPVEAIDEVVIGNVLSAGHGQNIARQITVNAGLPITTPAYTLNMVCGSGMKAVYEGFVKLKAGVNQAMIVGGVESMSQAPFLMDGSARQGVALGGASMVDSMMRDGLTDAFEGYAMGVTAETLAREYQLSRKVQDAFALQSQIKARHAQSDKLFEDEILPISYTTRRGEVVEVLQDESINYQTDATKLANLKPVFDRSGSVTAGNSSSINDGVALMCIVTEAVLTKYQLTPIVEVVDFAQSGVQPSVMGLGPIEAVTRLLDKTGYALTDVELFELNEAFAAQALAVEMGLSQTHHVSPEWLRERTNLKGGAIALGHPIGASGARIMTTLAHSMRQQNKKVGIASLCIGGGMGIAVLCRRI